MGPRIAHVVTPLPQGNRVATVVLWHQKQCLMWLAHARLGVLVVLACLRFTVTSVKPFLLLSVVLASYCMVVVLDSRFQRGRLHRVCAEMPLHFKDHLDDLNSGSFR